jgi:hypothetical protein
LDRPGIPAEAVMRRVMSAVLAEKIVTEMRRLHHEGIDDDDLLIELSSSFPDITLTDFVGALMLYRARGGAEGYALIPAKGKLNS